MAGTMFAGQQQQQQSDWRGFCKHQAEQMASAQQTVERQKVWEQEKAWEEALRISSSEPLSDHCWNCVRCQWCDRVICFKHGEPDIHIPCPSLPTLFKRCSDHNTLDEEKARRNDDAKGDYYTPYYAKTPRPARRNRNPSAVAQKTAQQEEAWEEELLISALDEEHCWSCLRCAECSDETVCPKHGLPDSHSPCPPYPTFMTEFRDHCDPAPSSHPRAVRRIHNEVRRTEIPTLAAVFELCQPKTRSTSPPSYSSSPQSSSAALPFNFLAFLTPRIENREARNATGEGSKARAEAKAKARAEVRKSVCNDSCFEKIANGERCEREGCNGWPGLCKEGIGRKERRLSVGW
ncbi:MAG: hypothetical protein M1827_004117 [Pycnora praestabilis]|nr:MAG: hypothetical protein M1827_004117 [Pycnora praestabilis]